MPQVENVSRLLEGKVPLGEPLPVHFIERARAHELSVRFSTIPLSLKLDSLLRATRIKSVHTIIDASRAYEPEQMAWQSVRLDNEGRSGQSGTGYEQFFMGRLDQTQTALQISTLGLQTQADHPDIVNKIRTSGVKSLSPRELIETEYIIETILKNVKSTMKSSAKEFRAQIKTDIAALPRDLTQSYYYTDQTNQLIAVATTLQRLPPHSSFRYSPDWQSIYQLARSEKINVDVQDLQRGRHIMDELGHAMGSFSRGLVSLIQR